jgi:hypothetical protein
MKLATGRSATVEVLKPGLSGTREPTIVRILWPSQSIQQSWISPWFRVKRGMFVLETIPNASCQWTVFSVQLGANIAEMKGEENANKGTVNATQGSLVYTATTMNQMSATQYG